MYEGSLCVCCMSTDDLKDLFTANNHRNKNENYSEMLQSSLNILVTPSDGHDSICEPCILKLRECVAFKEQVQNSLAILSSADVSDPYNTEYLDPSDEGDENEHNSEKLPERMVSANSNPDEETVLAGETCDEGKSAADGSSVQDQKPETRRRGRPRKHPVSSLPYKIEKDELVCRECKEEFPNNFTLKVHYNTHFGRHECPKCSRCFVTWQGLRKHETTHLTGPFPCGECGQEFRSLNTLDSHKRYHHGTALAFRCRHCERRFATLQRRARHAAEAHGVTERRHRCPYCGQMFMHSGDRIRHIASQHESTPVPCPRCGEHFRKEYLRAHLLRVHHIGKGYKCTFCPHMQPSRSALQKHMQSHLNDRRHVCKLCGDAFVQKGSLKYHIGSHVRRGEYDGDPARLLGYRARPGDRDTGILSEKETEASEVDTDDCIEEEIEKDLEENVSEDEEQHIEKEDTSEVTDIQSIELAQDIEDMDDILLDDDRFKLPSDVDMP